jgi:hypothetical protein
LTEEIRDIIADFVDYLMPELVPYEASLYLFLLRNSFLRDGSQQIRIGKRTMAQGFGAGSRGVKTNFAHMTTVIHGLEEKGCLTVGDTTHCTRFYFHATFLSYANELRPWLPSTRLKTILQIPRRGSLYSKETNGSVSTVAKGFPRTMPRLTTTFRKVREVLILRQIYELPV